MDDQNKDANSSSDNGQNSMGASRPINIKADALETAGPLKDKIIDTIEDRKETGADKLKDLAGAVTNAAAGFDEHMPKVAQYIRDAGSWVEQSAIEVREQKFEDLLVNAGTFARDKPGLAFGVAALSGFALSRFLKSERPSIQTPKVRASEPTE